MTSLAVRLEDGKVCFIEGKTKRGMFNYYDRRDIEDGELHNFVVNGTLVPCIDAVSEEFNISKPLAMIWIINYKNTLEEIQELGLTYTELLLCYQMRHKVSQVYGLKDLVFKIKERPNIPWPMWGEVGHSSVILEAQTIDDIVNLTAYIRNIGMKHVKKGWTKIPCDDAVGLKSGLSQEVISKLRSFKVKDDNIINASGLFKLLNFKYVEEISSWSITYGQMLKGGITHKQMYEWYTARNSTYGLPFDVFKKAINIHTSCGFGKIDKKKGIDIICNWRIYVVNQYNKKNGSNIMYYPETYLVMLWAYEHFDWCIKTQNYVLDDGQTVTIHYHNFITYITDSMLKSGIKTSPSVVMEQIHERINMDIKIQLNQVKELPVCEKEIKNFNIKQILTADDLVAEGNNMKHCVAGYISKIARRESFIFHVDDGTEYGATAEVVQKGSKWSVTQCRSVRNSSAPLALEMIKQEFNVK